MSRSRQQMSFSSTSNYIFTKKDTDSAAAATTWRQDGKFWHLRIKFAFKIRRARLSICWGTVSQVPDHVEFLEFVCHENDISQTLNWHVKKNLKRSSSFGINQNTIIPASFVNKLFIFVIIYIPWRHHKKIIIIIIIPASCIPNSHRRNLACIKS